MPPNSVPNLPEECRRFFELLRRHWKAGTGLASHDKRAAERDRCWTVRTFSNAMGWAGYSQIDRSTVESWLNGERWPQLERKNAILKVLFCREPSTNEAADREYQAMERAWESGQVARNRPKMGNEREFPDVSDRWMAANGPIRTPGLASLTLDEPHQGNEVARFYISARLLIDIAEHELDDGSSVFVGLKSAFLTVGTFGCRVVNRSMIGELTLPLWLNPV